MVARHGPAVLETLRSDEDLVATTIKKAQWQSVYRAELREVLAALDSVSKALQQRGSHRGR